MARYAHSHACIPASFIYLCDTNKFLRWPDATHERVSVSERTFLFPLSLRSQAMSVTAWVQRKGRRERNKEMDDWPWPKVSAKRQWPVIELRSPFLCHFVEFLDHEYSCREAVTVRSVQDSHEVYISFLSLFFWPPSLATGKRQLIASDGWGQ